MRAPRRVPLQRGVEENAAAEQAGGSLYSKATLGLIFPGCQAKGGGAVCHRQTEHSRPVTVVRFS